MRDTYSYLLATLPIPEYRRAMIPSHHLLGQIIDNSYHHQGYLLLEQLFKVQMVESPKYWVDSRILNGNSTSTSATAANSGVEITSTTDSGVDATGAADSVNTATVTANIAADAQDQSVGFGTIVYANCKRIKAFLLEHIELVAHTKHEPLVVALHSAMHNILQAQSNPATDEQQDNATKQEHQRHEEYWTMLKMELDLLHKQSVDAISDVAAPHPIEQAYQNWRQFYFGVRGEIARSSVLAQSHDERLEWPYTDSQYTRNLLLDIENSDNPLVMTKAVERFIYDWMYGKFVAADSPPIARLFWYYVLTVANERSALLNEQHGQQALSKLIANNKQRVHSLITQKLKPAHTAVGG